MLTIWKNGKYQPLVKYVTLKDLKKLSNAIDIINGDSDTKGSIKKAIKDLVGEAPEAYDTLKEIADKLKSDDDLHKALNDAIILKASSDALNTEINRATYAETTNKNAIDGEVTRAKSAEKSLQDQITSNDSDITNLTAKHESLSRKVQGITATGGANTATNVTYNNNNSGLNAENVQDVIDELQGSKIDKTSILQESGDAEDKVMSQKAVSDKLSEIKYTSGQNSLSKEGSSNVKGFIQSTGTWALNNIKDSFLIAVNGGELVEVFSNEFHGANIYLLKSFPDKINNGDIADFASISIIPTMKGRLSSLKLPSDVKCLVVRISDSAAGNEYLPKSIKINGYDYYVGLYNNYSKLFKSSERIDNISNIQDNCYSFKIDDFNKLSLGLNGWFNFSPSYYNGAINKFIRVKEGATYSFRLSEEAISNGISFKYRIIAFDKEYGDSIKVILTGYKEVESFSIPAGYNYILFSFEMYKNGAVVEMFKNYKDNYLSLTTDADKEIYPLCNLQKWIDNFGNESATTCITKGDLCIANKNIYLVGGFNKTSMYTKTLYLRRDNKPIVVKFNVDSSLIPVFGLYGYDENLNLISSDSRTLVSSQQVMFNANLTEAKYFMIIFSLYRRSDTNTELNLHEVEFEPCVIQTNLAKSSVLCGDTIDTYNDYEEYHNKLLQMSCKARTYTPSTNPLTLLWFSDLHGDASNLSRLMWFYRTHYYEHTTNASLIDDILNSGDIVESFWGSDYTFYDSIYGTNKILNVIGNHDVMADSGLTTYKDKKDVYARYVKPNVSNWNVVQPSNAEENGLNYYYKDYASKKIRLICIDVMYLDDNQTSWINTVLTEAIEKELSVVVCNHYPVNINVIKCQFSCHDYNIHVNNNVATLSENVLSIIDDFINNGGKFICHLCGHTHEDAVGIAVGHPKQLVIVMDTSGNSAQSMTRCAYKEQKGQDCFNIVSFDIYTKCVKLARVGADYDIYGRHIDMMAISYESFEVL